MTKTHCNQTAKSSRRTDDGKTIYSITCTVCGIKGEGVTPQDAEQAFDMAASESSMPQHATTTTTAKNRIAPNTPALAAPINATQLPAYILNHSTELAEIAAPFVRTDRPAFAMMVKKNTRYVMQQSGKAWDKVWQSRDGQESVVTAMEDAFILGATMPDMGCIVPYNGIAEFIPAVEAYTFAATTGRSSPFETLNIEAIYKNDITEVSRINGEFSINFKKIGVPRGEVVAVAVYGILKETGKQVGEIYEADRLLEKAKTHSAGYRAYREKLAQFEFAKSEGKLKEKDGRPYVLEHVEYIKDGQKKEFDKEVFFEDITNPYDGADRPEMLRKVAGKSFLAPYMKTRNSTAAMAELDNDKDAASLLDAALADALDTVPGGEG